MAILEALRITKTYGRGRLQVKALRNASLTVDASEAVALMGPSGSGKSTMLAVIGLMTPASAGRLVIGGTEVPDDEGSRARLRNEFFGYVHQDYAVIDDETVERNVVIPLEYARPRIARSERRNRVEEALADVKMDWATGKRANQLSAGERQRVAIARALVSRPKVVLADEPTAALDAGTARSIVSVLLSLRDKGAAIVIATHDPRVADRCNRTVQMYDGRIKVPDEEVDDQATADEDDQAPAPTSRRRG